ncbi:DUF3606 domain-containing protein [Herminiimonas sp.]
MADDTQPKKAVDRTKININESHEFQYWCICFDCTTDEL